MLIRNLTITHELPESIRRSAELDFTPIWATIGELQARKQLFNPLAYINPLVRGQLLPAVVDKFLDARKKLENLLAQQITEFTKYWKSRLTENNQSEDQASKAHQELEELLNKAGLEETTKEGLWRIIRAEQ
jgi:transcription initiation factor TFIIIB Brf1 subunit/transcription initiation factor TFIIB